LKDNPEIMNAIEHGVRQSAGLLDEKLVTPIEHDDSAEEK